MADETPPAPPGFIDIPAPPPGFQRAAIDPRAIDSASGAPARVRLSVGSAQTPKDRLATIRKFFPDAQPYDGDNFVYTDPKTKRPTLYNDKGWMPSVGDIASIAPEIGEFVGGTMGGVAAVPPAAAGAIPTGGLSTLAVPVGVGLGAAAGREAVQQYAKHFLDTEDTRGMGERFADAGTTGLLNAGGTVVADAALRGLRKISGPVRDSLTGKTFASVADFQNAGVTPSAGAVTGNRGVQQTEKALAAMPGGAPVMQRLAKTQADEIGAGVGREVGRLGVPGTPQQAGESMVSAAKAAADRFNKRQGTLYDDAFAKVGADTTVDPLAIRALNDQLKSELARAPMSQKAALSKAIAETDAMLADTTATGGIPFDTWRSIRTNIGRDINNPVLAGSTGAQNEGLKRVYSAVSDDMRGVAEAAGPEAAKALTLADRYTRRQMTQNLPAMQKIADMPADEQVYRWAMGEANLGGSRLLQLRKNFTSEQWDNVAATVLDNMGKAKPGARGAAELGGASNDFSVSTFLTNWERMAPEARKALYGGKRYADIADQLDSLVKVARSVKDVERMGNPSGTGRTLLSGGSMALAGERLITGQPGEAAGIIFGSHVAPYITAKMITNPAFVKWLAGAEAFGARSPTALSSMTGRLGVIAEANPEIRDEVLRFRQQLAAPPSPQPQR